MATALDQLRWALQALTAPADQQIRLFPSFACVPDELVLDFDQWYREAGKESRFSPDQESALAKLDELIAIWSGPSHPEVWIEAALTTHPAWLGVRILASKALAAFDWPDELPPLERGAIYVGPPGT